ncbi:MAG: hypothetical protein N3G79_03110 [Sulfolobales archaeon]|nr:hypothetical protein [Sulfolobales archaeon]
MEVADTAVLKVVRTLCELGAVDVEILKHRTGLDSSTIERAIGVLLSSSYIVPVELGENSCGSCPLSSLCSSKTGGGGARIYVASRNLRKFCEDSGARILRYANLMTSSEHSS